MAVVVVVTAEGGRLHRSDPAPLTLPGQVIIGVVADLHEAGEEEGACGALRAGAVEQVAAAHWALSTINNQSQHDYTIGLRVFDGCSNADMAQRQMVQLLHNTQPPHPPLLGVLAVGSEGLVEGVVGALQGMSVPLLVTEAGATHDVPTTHNLFTTAPQLSHQLQAVVWAAMRLSGGLPGVSLVSSCGRAAALLQEQAVTAGLNVSGLLVVEDSDNLTALISAFISGQKAGGVVVLLLTLDQLSTFRTQVDQQLLTPLHWVLTTLGGEALTRQLSQDWLQHKFSGSVLVEAESPVISGFSKYLAESLATNSSVVAPLTHQYLHTTTHCNHQEGVVRRCRSPDRRTLAQRLSGLATTATVRAVSSLAAAFRLVQIEKCSHGVHCLPALSPPLHHHILVALLKLSYKVEGEPARHTADGQLSNTFSLHLLTPSGPQKVGEYRDTSGITWVPGQSLHSGMAGAGSHHPAVMPPHSHGQPGPGDRGIQGPVAEEDGRQQNVKAVPLTHQGLVRRRWAVTVLVLACLGVAASLYITVYVALRVCDGTLTGPQLLGGVLLLGVMGSYACCVLYVLPATTLSCTLREWLPPLCLAVCYSVILVKCMHLRALVTLGSGGQVSHLNLVVSLLFMVGVQGALCMLGGVGELPSLTPVPDPALWEGSLHCALSQRANLATRIYLLLILLLSLILATLNSRIERNHNEARWLLLSSCASVPVVAAWAVTSFLAPPALEPPTTSLALLLLASLILTLFFIPKMRIIAIQAQKFRHKQLAAGASISTVLSQVDEGAPTGLIPVPEMLPCRPSDAIPSDHKGSVRSSLASHSSYQAAFAAVYGVTQEGSPPHHMVTSPLYHTFHGAFP